MHQSICARVRSAPASLPVFKAVGTGEERRDIAPIALPHCVLKWILRRHFLGIKILVNSKKEAKFEYLLSNFGSFSYFQTSLSLRVGQVLQKLPKFDINDLKLLFHCYILILRRCPRKTPFKTQCPRLRLIY